MSRGLVVVDTNLLVLLVVGSASRSYISKHKRLKGDYTAGDFDLLVLLISEFSDLVLMPHVLTEVSNIARQIDPPARIEIQAAFRTLIMTCTELSIPSAHGVQRAEFMTLGLTDAMLLHLCAMKEVGLNPTLISVDSDLVDAAHAQGYSVIDYRRDFVE